MKGLASLLLSIGMAMLCWGVYGPVLREGQLGMSGSSLRPFICVGLAYFLIAVLAPVVALQADGRSRALVHHGHRLEPGGRRGRRDRRLGNHSGAEVSRQPGLRDAAGVRRRAGGQYALTMYWNKSFKQVSPMFLAGLILVVCGAVTVLFNRPSHHPPTKAPAAAATAEAAAKPTLRTEARDVAARHHLHADDRAGLGRVWPDAASRPDGHGRQPAAAADLRRPVLLSHRRDRAEPAVARQWDEPGQFTSARARSGAWPAARPARLGRWASSWPSTSAANRSSSCRWCSAARR